MSNSRVLGKFLIVIILHACAVFTIAAPMAAASSVGAAAAGSMALDTSVPSFRVNPDSGAFEIEDKSGGVVWRSDFRAPRFGEATLQISGHPRHIDLAKCKIERTGGGLDLTFHPLASQPQAQIVVSVRPAAEGDGLRFTYAASPDLKLESIRLLDRSLMDHGRGARVRHHSCPYGPVDSRSPWHEFHSHLRYLCVRRLSHGHGGSGEERRGGADHLG